MAFKHAVSISFRPKHLSLLNYSKIINSVSFSSSTSDNAGSGSSKTNETLKSSPSTSAVRPTNAAEGKVSKANNISVEKGTQNVDKLVAKFKSTLSFHNPKAEPLTMDWSPDFKVTSRLPASETPPLVFSKRNKNLDKDSFTKLLGLNDEIGLDEKSDDNDLLFEDEVEEGEPVVKFVDKFDDEDENFGFNLSQQGQSRMKSVFSGSESGLSIMDAVPKNEYPGVVFRIIDSDRTVTMTTKGKVSSMRALIVSGNARGAAGFGMGKGKTIKEAMMQAKALSLKNWVSIAIAKDGQLFHDVVGTWKGTKVLMRRVNGDKRGLKCSKIVLAICEAFGIEHVVAKVLTRKRSPYNLCSAVFQALGQHSHPDDIALTRERKVQRLYDFHYPVTLKRERLNVNDLLYTRTPNVNDADEVLRRL